MSARILSRREVESRTGLPTSTLYDYIGRWPLPAPLQVGAAHLPHVPPSALPRHAGGAPCLALQVLGTPT